MRDLCRCGHYEREHAVIGHDIREAQITSCSGHVIAYPDDAEGGSDGCEVRCMCSRGFDPMADERRAA